MERGPTGLWATSRLSFSIAVNHPGRFRPTANCHRAEVAEGEAATRGTGSVRVAGPLGQWIDELEEHPLDYFEYEALLLHVRVWMMSSRLPATLRPSAEPTNWTAGSTY